MQRFAFGQTAAGTSKTKVPVKDVRTINPEIGACKKVVDAQVIEEKLAVSNEEKRILTERARKRLASLPEFTITGTDITLFGYKQLKDAAVCKVSNDKISGSGSVNDAQMGPGLEDKNDLCQTCHLAFMDCPGHLGYIDLNVLIYHPFYFREIIQVLSCLCGSCSKLLLTKKQISELGINRLKYKNRLDRMEIESAKIKSCSVPPEELKGGAVKKCGHKHVYHSQKFKETLSVQYSTKAGGEEETSLKVLDIKAVKDILDAISDEDAETLGFSPKTGTRPVNMILQALPVVPPVVRYPDFRNGVVIQSEITKQYIKIIKANNGLSDMGASRNKKITTIEEAENDRKNKEKNLFGLIKHLFESGGAEYAGAGFKSFKTLLQGKNGIPRRLLMGKTNDLAGRTVIGPDPTIKFGQVGIPEMFASKLTIKEIVCQYNIDSLNELLQEKEYIIKTTNQEKETTYTRYGRKITHIVAGPKRNNPGAIYSLQPGVKYTLKMGDEVWRHLRNGDMIMFGRQPTLHKHSLMAYEVVLRSQLTIGLHPSSTTPHNADFKMVFQL